MKIILFSQGEPGASGLSGVPGLPGEDGAPGQKVTQHDDVWK